MSRSGTIEQFDAGRFDEILDRNRHPHHANYYAMYSSVIGGIVTDPALMLLPVDDHMVHRGDGVFEVFKCVGGKIYNMQAHLERLQLSADVLGYRDTPSMQEITHLVIETVKAGGRRECVIRLFISRGTGSFDTNPYDCQNCELYIVITSSKPSPMQQFPRGIKGKVSEIPAKRPFIARVKSVNYLMNVLMRKEAIDAAVNFVVSLDEQKRIAEGATENIGVITDEKKLLFPVAERTLRGTTMIRVIELAQELIAVSHLAAADFADLSVDDILGAKEVFIAGTSTDIAAVTEFEGQKIGDGKPGPIWRKLSALLDKDVRTNSALSTPVFGE